LEVAYYFKQATHILMHTRHVCLESSRITGNTQYVLHLFISYKKASRIFPSSVDNNMLLLWRNLFWTN